MTKHTPFQIAVKKAILASDLGQDKTVCKADGSVHIARYFFYSHGNTSFKWAHKVQDVLTIAGFRFYVDDYTTYGKDTYFVAVVTPPSDGDYSGPLQA